MLESGRRDHFDAGVERGVRVRTVGDDERGTRNEEQPLGRRVGTARRAQGFTIGDDRDAVDPAKRARGASVDAQRTRIVVVVGDVTAGNPREARRARDTR